MIWGSADAEKSKVHPKGSLALYFDCTAPFKIQMEHTEQT